MTEFTRSDLKSALEFAQALFFGVLIEKLAQIVSHVTGQTSSFSEIEQMFVILAILIGLNLAYYFVKRSEKTL